jgi:hypothetical protein
VLGCLGGEGWQAWSSCASPHGRPHPHVPFPCPCHVPLRFSSLGGLKLLLSSELDAIAKTGGRRDAFCCKGRASLRDWGWPSPLQHPPLLTCPTPRLPSSPGGVVTRRLEELDAVCDNPSRDTVEQAATCGRCRAELGARGRLCAHCALDDRVLQWELRLFTLTTRAIALGAAVGSGAGGGGGGGAGGACLCSSYPGCRPAARMHSPLPPAPRAPAARCRPRPRCVPRRHRPCGASDRAGCMRPPARAAPPWSPRASAAATTRSPRRRCSTTPLRRSACCACCCSTSTATLAGGRARLGGRVRSGGRARLGGQTRLGTAGVAGRAAAHGSIPR